MKRIENDMKLYDNMLFKVPLLAIIAKYGFPIRERPLLYQVFLGIYAQNSIVNGVFVYDLTVESAIITSN